MFTVVVSGEVTNLDNSRYVDRPHYANVTLTLEQDLLCIVDQSTGKSWSLRIVEGQPVLINSELT